MACVMHECQRMQRKGKERKGKERKGKGRKEREGKKGKGREGECVRACVPLSPTHDRALLSALCSLFCRVSRYKHTYADASLNSDSPSMTVARRTGALFSSMKAITATGSVLPKIAPIVSPWYICQDESLDTKCRARGMMQ